MRYACRILIKEILDASITPPALGRHSEKKAAYNQEMGSHQTPNLLAPCSWTSLSPKL